MVRIFHRFKEPVFILRRCNLCGVEYGFLLWPGVNVYPEYCEQHRNVFRRTFFSLGCHGKVMTNFTFRGTNDK